MPVRARSRQAVRFIGTVLDISVHKQAEALMQRAMEHQEVLTREVSHRVKNSLALVASLLGLQARAASDPRVKQAIADAEMRIGTVARVHDHLWRQPEVSIVDLSAFLRDLCANLQATAPAQHCLVCEAEPIMVPTDQAIPLGLIGNELVTNAFKYAYPSGDGGEVRVRIDRMSLASGWKCRTKASVCRRDLMRMGDRRGRAASA